MATHPVSVERDIERAFSQHGREDTRVRTLEAALFKATGPAEGDDAHLADPLFELRTIVDAEIMKRLAYHAMGWLRGEPSVTLSVNAPQPILDQLQARGYRLVSEPGFDDVIPPKIRVDLGAAVGPPSDVETYERIRQRWRRLIHAYDERDTGRHPTMDIDANTPGAILRMLEADGYHFRREGNLLTMY